MTGLPVSSYYVLLEFVSWHFQCTRERSDTILVCRTHGEVCRWSVPFRDGELTLMRAIGEHMDDVEHQIEDPVTLEGISREIERLSRQLEEDQT